MLNLERFLQDYRADFSRGHHVSSQRVRYRRQEIRCRHDITSFTPQLMAIYESLTPPEEEKLKQRQLLQYLQKLVTQEWPDARLHLYGSCANSFGASNSDIDVCLQIPDLKIEKAEILLRLAEILESNNLQDVQVNFIFNILEHECHFSLSHVIMNDLSFSL